VELEGNRVVQDRRDITIRTEMDSSGARRTESPGRLP